MEQQTQQPLGLKFIDGTLHQLVIVTDDEGTSTPTWVEVPSETTV